MIFLKALLTGTKESCQCGKLYADKGDIAQWLTQKLQSQGITLLTKLRKNMKPTAPTPFDQLKNFCQIEHSSHCFVANFMCNPLQNRV